MNFSFITNWLKNYNIRELFLWIQTTAVHPANQLFQIRFELLLCLLFSIRPEKFRNKDLTRDQFENFIEDFDKRFSHHFHAVEDWKPFNQLKLIPYFLNRGKYYFSYGNLERPYEFLRQFENLFLIDKDEDTPSEFLVIKKMLTLSLEFQSRIIERLTKIDEAKIKSEKIYVPTQAFFNEISLMFTIDPQQLSIFECLSILQPGAFKDTRKGIYGSYDPELFSTFHVHLFNNDYYLLPQLHLEILYKFANQVVETSSNKEAIKALILKNFVWRLQRRCTQFFTIRKVLDRILQAGTNKNLAEGTDFVVRIDADKLFFFKVAKHSLEIDSSNHVENALMELQKIIDDIRKEQIIGLRYLNGEVIAVPSGAMEFWAVMVFENTTLHYKIKLSRYPNRGNNWIVNMMDLNAIFEFLPSDMSLIKFLRNDQELSNKLKVVSVDYLDRFAYYISNTESYPRIGITPSMMIFRPHEWHDFFHEKLFQKYQDNIHKLVEFEFPNAFNHVKKYRDNIYEVIDTGWLSGGLAVKWDEHLTWVMYPPYGFNNTKEEIRWYSGLIGPLYADYLNRLHKPLVELFRKYNSDFEKDYLINIYPASYIERNEELRYLRSDVSQIKQNNPLAVVTYRIGGSHKILSWVIYDYQYLDYVFAPQENAGERFCIKQLIKSLVLFFDDKISEAEADHIAESFVDRYIPLRAKGYSCESFSVDNPRLDAYPKHQDISKADIAKVNSEIAEFLAMSNFKPGEYHGDEAKYINNSIFQFLQGRLEEEIRKYNQSLLFYAYEQIELIEGRREKSRIQFGMDASKYTEYDIIQKNIETTLEISTAATSAKHLIETLLKVGIKGTKVVTNEDWHYLHAIAVVLYDTATISDYIHFDIVSHILRITDLYEIEDIRGEETFSHEKFYQVESELKVNSARRLLVKSKIMKHGEVQSDRDIIPFPDLLKEVNEAFKAQMGFSFDDFVTVLYVLGRMDLFHEYHFPLSLVSEQVLIRKLKENIQDSLDEAEIKKILNFASLDFTIYAPHEELIPSRLLRRKERLNLCPLIYLDPGEYLYGNQICLGVSRFWLHSITSADYPYALQENSPIDEALAKLHRHLDRELEKEAEVIARQTLGTDNVESTIDNFKRLSPSFPAKPDCGEIDLLAINRYMRTIFVLDAKNRNRKIRPYDIRQEMKKYFEGKRSYLALLTQKERFVQLNLKEILNYFAIQSDEGWEVRKAFVVNTNYPSAYCLEKGVDFVLLSNLPAYLKGQGDNGCFT